MRKSIIAILSLVAMVACTNDVTVMTQTPAAITFEDSFVEVKTRAAVDPSITTADIDAFDVWGFMDDPNGLMFDAQRVTKGEEGWTYSPLQYWTQDHNYFFYAVAPVNNADIVVNKDLNIEGLGTIDFTNTDGSVDLLYAEKQESTYNENVNADGHETIKLTFAHLLSKVKFTFTNGFPEGTSSLKIENIKISQAPSKGTVTLNDDNAGRTWKISDSNATLDFGHVNGGVALLPNESAECDNERLTIPADANVRYKIDFTATLYYGKNEALKSEKTVYLEDQAFVIGKNYNITATIDNTNIAEDALKPIIFDVVEVEEWDLGDHNGKIDFENGGTQVNPGEPVEEGYKLYFNNLANWTKVYAHIWANEGEDLGLTAIEWPGRELTETEELDGVTYYVFQLPATANGKTVNVVFNDGAGSQTEDLAGVAKGNLFFDNYVEPAPEPEPTDTVLYLTPNSNWKQANARFAAYFFNNGEAWVDMTLVEGESDIYSVVVPDGFVDVIFVRMNPSASANNWDNKWNQTSDLKVPTDGTNHYTVAEGAWDKGAGSWSTYTPAVKPEPVALDAPVVATSVNVNVVTLTWEAVTGASHYTVQVDDDVEEVVNATSYEFNGDYEVTYQFTVKAIAADKDINLDSAATVVTATTEAEPAVAPTYTTVAEFLAADVNDTTYYTLKGTITSVANTQYGNFDLTDETGTIYVWGLYSEDGATNKYWAASGAKLGDDIVISAVRAEYNGSAQAGSARFMGLTSPGTLAFWTFDATSASFTAAASEKKINVAIYNTSSEVVATSDNAQFSAAYADGVLTVSALENTSTEGIEGNITITCGALTQVVTVSQLGASSSEQTTNSATISFEDKANRTSYTTSQQVWEQNGIKVTNDKASSTSNVGDYANPARFYKSSNVTIEAPGAILSISINVSGVESKYTSAWGTADNGIVTITLDGSSNTYEFNTLSAQARAYSMTVTYIE